MIDTGRPKRIDAAGCCGRDELPPAGLADTRILDEYPRGIAPPEPELPKSLVYQGICGQQPR